MRDKTYRPGLDPEDNREMLVSHDSSKPPRPEFRTQHAEIVTDKDGNPFAVIWGKINGRDWQLAIVSKGLFDKAFPTRFDVLRFIEETLEGKKDLKDA